MVRSLLLDQYGIDTNPKKIQKTFFILFAMGITYSFPIWFADRYYIDDLGRSIAGYTGWQNVGRPFAGWFMSILNFQNPWNVDGVVDSSPLLQILSVTVLAFTAAVFCFKIFDNKVDHISILVVFPIIGSPFLLENLSYKFDAFTMTAALAFSIIAAIDMKNKILDILIGSALIFLALGLYQPSVNSFIGATVILILSSYWNNKTNTFTILYMNLIKFATGSVVYYNIVLTFFPAKGNYAENHSVLVSANAEGWFQILKNFRQSTENIIEFFWQIPVFSIAGISAVLLFGVRLITSELNVHDKLLRSVAFVIGSIVIFFSSFGIIVFLKEPIFQPRVFVGFTVFLVFVFYCFSEVFAERSRAARKILIIPVYYLFYLSFTYGATAKAQTEYDYQLATSIRQNLENHDFASESYLIFDGIQPKSPVLENSSRIKIITKLVQLHINNQWYWGYVFMQHQGLKFKRLASIEKALREICKLSPVYRSQRYKIFKSNDVFIVAFRNGRCFENEPTS